MLLFRKLLRQIPPRKALQPPELVFKLQIQKHQSIPEVSQQPDL